MLTVFGNRKQDTTNSMRLLVNINVKSIYEDKLELSNTENERCSGMGGEIEVYDFSDASYEYKGFCHKDISEALKERGLTEDELNHYVLVDIDWARRKTIDFLFSNFKCINCEIIDDDKIYSICEILSYGNLKHNW